MAGVEVVVVTGASGGIGRATARAFAQQGARVALLARGLDGLEGARREVEAAGGQALVIPTDMSHPEQVESAAEQVERELGPIDIWVNNAMVTIFSAFKDITPEEFKQVTEVTYLGFVYGTQTALKRMLVRDRGTIVQVGSALSYRAIPLQSAYCGAKFAVRGFTDAIRSELIHEGSGVHITEVHLAAFNTPQFDWARAKLPKKPQPLPPIYQPEIAAQAIVWAAHHRRRELWVGAPAVKAIMGNKVAPGVLDYVLASQAYSGQMADEDVEPDRRDNLFEPVPGDHGAHGRFDAQARSTSQQLWMSQHRGALLGGAMLPLALMGVLALSSMRRR